MPNPRLIALKAKRDTIEEAKAAIDGAVSLRSDLSMSDDETTEYEKLRAASEQVDKDIADLAEDLDRQRSVSETIARLQPAEGHSQVLVRSEPNPLAGVTPAEYAAAVYRSDPRVNQATEADTILLRTIQETGTADTAGILPTPIVGDLIKFVDASRPVVGAMRSMPMPAKGKVFQRPRLTQGTQSAVQTEKGQLNSRQLTTTGDNVTKTTHGTVLRLTEQDIDWSDPAILDIAYEDMAQEYAIDTETTAATAVAALTTNTTALDITSANADEFVNAMALAASSVYSTSKQLPDVVFAGVNAWALMAAMTDTTGRPLFPNLSPVNALGSLDLTSFAGNPMGLKLVVSPNFTTNYLAVGASRYLEVYEQNKGFATIGVVSVLEQEVAYRGYFATNCYDKALCTLA